ncbi:MAG: redoxin domain-containing protein, partial [Candidatus Atribacteria bacterium]|nr:redoxin domain-containing protein [Candidatus Atribacteria bacterium]
MDHPWKCLQVTGMKGDPYHTMKKILAVVIIIAVALVVWVVMARVVLRVQVEKDFTLNDLNGKPFVLNSVGGQPIILTFVLSRCPECKTEATNLNRMY